MWLGGFKSHLSAEALWVLMHINEMGAVTLHHYPWPVLWTGLSFLGPLLN